MTFNSDNTEDNPIQWGQIAKFDEPIGRVYQPDSRITENVTKVLVIRRRDGTVRSSYPITDEYALSLLAQEGRN